MEQKICWSLLLIATLLFSAKGTVIGIDFGSQYYKAVLVQPGSPFAILENTSSQRKTENALVFTAEERAYEKDAIIQSVSYPTTTVTNPSELLGMKYSEDNISKLKTNYLLSNDFIKDERGLVGYQISLPEDKEFVNVEMFTEEMIAMVLRHLKDLAKKQTKTTPTDVAITVPSHFTINQRMMIQDAAELAGLNVLSLVNENLAAGLMYAIDTKGIQYPTQILLVNMGASDLELSIVKIDKVLEKGKSDKEIKSVHVIDEIAIKDVGGYAFDIELAKILAERFDSLPERKDKESILNNPKIVKRLMREILKIKEVLSTNKSVPVKMLAVADDINLEFTLDRELFESRIKPIIEKARPAFEKILENHPIDTFSEIEIIGGGLRVPLVKDFISSFAAGKTLSTHLNPDEAMAFGSAYIAANFSSSYQVQKVYLYQSVPHNIYANITQSSGCKSEDTEDCFKKHLEIFSKTKDFLGMRKNVNIDHHVEDMNIVLYYIDYLGNENVILTSKVRGVDKVKSSPIYAKDNISDKMLTLSFKYDKSGILKITKAEVTLTERIEETVKVKEKSDDSSSTEDSQAKEVDKTRVKTKTHSFDVKVTDKLEGGSPLNAAQKSKAKKHLSDLDKRDSVIEKSKIAKNEYEMLIYSSRSFLEDEDNLQYMKDEDEKSKLLLFLDEEENWLYTLGVNAKEDAYKIKYKVVDKKMVPIRNRKSAREKIPEEFRSSKKIIEENEKAFNSFIKNKNWLPKEKLDEFKSMVTAKREYLDQKNDEMTKTPTNNKLSFTINDIRKEINKLTDLLKDIKKIKKPKEPQKEVKSKGNLVESQESQESSQTENENEENTDQPMKVNVEEVDVSNMSYNITDDLNLKPGMKISPHMREQANKILKIQQLKSDIVEGKINPEDLTPEELDAVMRS